MGQRHQVYLKLPEVYYNENNPNNTSQVIGIHHQWLFGQRAVLQLLQCLKFIESQDEYGPFVGRRYYDTEEALGALYSVNAQDGYFHITHPITKDLEENGNDPGQFDNNDGITIIDVSGKTVKYCFMSLHHLEGEAADKVENLVPLNAHEYLHAYYPKYKTAKGKKKQDKDFYNKSRQAIENLKSFEVLTLKEVKEIFPSLYGIKGNVLELKPAKKKAKA